VEQDYGKTYSGTSGTYIDTDGGTILPGWCAESKTGINQFSQIKNILCRQNKIRRNERK